MCNGNAAMYNKDVLMNKKFINVKNLIQLSKLQNCSNKQI